MMSKADHAVQWADYDRDGALDLVLTSLEGGATVLHNLLPSQTSRRSLEISVLDSSGSRRAGIRGPSLWSERHVARDAVGKLHGDGYGGQSVQPVHFGLSRMTRVNVEVTYLTANGRKVQRVDNVDPRKFIGKTLVVRQAVE